MELCASLCVLSSLLMPSLGAAVPDVCDARSQSKDAVSFFQAYSREDVRHRREQDMVHPDYVSPEFEQKLAQMGEVEDAWTSPTMLRMSEEAGLDSRAAAKAQMGAVFPTDLVEVVEKYSFPKDACSAEAMRDGENSLVKLETAIVQRKYPLVGWKKGDRVDDDDCAGSKQTPDYYAKNFRKYLNVNGLTQSHKKDKIKSFLLLVVDQIEKAGISESVVKSLEGSAQDMEDEALNTQLWVLIMDSFGLEANVNMDIYATLSPRENFNKLLEPIKQGIEQPLTAALGHLFGDPRDVYAAWEALKDLNIDVKQLGRAINSLMNLDVFDHFHTYIHLEAAKIIQETAFKKLRAPSDGSGPTFSDTLKSLITSDAISGTLKVMSEASSGLGFIGMLYAIRSSQTTMAKLAAAYVNPVGILTDPNFQAGMLQAYEEWPGMGAFLPSAEDLAWSSSDESTEKESRRRKASKKTLKPEEVAKKAGEVLKSAHKANDAPVKEDPKEIDGEETYPKRESDGQLKLLLKPFMHRDLFSMFFDDPNVQLHRILCGDACRCPSDSSSPLLEFIKPHRSQLRVHFHPSRRRKTQKRA